MSSILIKGGQIVDGSANPAFAAGLLVEDGAIKDVIRPGTGEPPAQTIIDASGKTVAPGFIDMHSHADWFMPTEKSASLMTRMLEQGVTTVVAGNCGISPAPYRPEAQDKLERLASICLVEPLEYKWQSMAEYLDFVQEQGQTANLAELVGHSAIRYKASDTRRGDMPEQDLAACLEETKKALGQGACGVSMGLGYDPGMYSSLEELARFFEVAAEANKPVTVHLKALSRISPCYPYTDLSPHNLRALSEMLELAEKTGAALQISHFIFVGRRSFGTAGRALEMVDKARERGVDVMIDAFPYTCGNTTIVVPFPYWFLARVPQAYHSRLARARLRLELEVGFRLVGFTYKDFQVMDAGVQGWEDLNGLRITQVAKKWKTSPFQAMMTLAEKSHGSSLMLFHAYSGVEDDESALEQVLAKPYCLFETDAIVKEKGYPNPAAIGTFPRILGRYAREHNLFSLEDAIHRMTEKSAQRFGIKDRGTIAPGKAADLVIFDHNKIGDNPPQGARPAGRPSGIDTVVVNGQIMVKDGKAIQGPRPGQVLRT